MPGSNLGVAGAIVLAALLVVGLVLWGRGRGLGIGGGGFGRIDLASGFPRTRRSGYSAEDVEGLLDRAYMLAGDPDGRAEALTVLHGAQFGLARGDGYDPIVVDLHVDAMITALQTGRDLPPRPGVR